MNDRGLKIEEIGMQNDSPTSQSSSRVVSQRFPPQAFHPNRLCVTQDECLGSHYFHRGQTTTGRLSPNTNTEEGTLTQESGDVRSVEGEVCGAVLVDE